MRFEIDENWIYVDVPEAQGKKLDGVWNAKRKMYKLPNTLGALRELYKIHPTPELAEYGKKKASQKQFMLGIKNSQDVTIYDDRLRPYQNQDIRYLKELNHGGLFLEQRLGKTPVSIRLFEEEGRKKNVVVCPASLVINWSNEVRKWSDKTPYVVKGTKNQRMKIYDTFKHATEGYLIISKDTLRSDIDVLEKM